MGQATYAPQRTEHAFSIVCRDSAEYAAAPNPMNEPGPTAPADWYLDPTPGAPGGQKRYWDGTAWTGHVSPAGALPQPAPTVAETSQGVGIWLGASVALMVVGALGPWATALGGVATKSGTSGDGVFVLVAAAMSLPAAYYAIQDGSASHLALAAAIVGAVIAALTTIIDIVDINGRGPLVSTGWGIWVATIAAASLFVAAIRLPAR